MVFWDCKKKNNNRVVCNNCIYYDDRGSNDSTDAMCLSPDLTEIDSISGKREPEPCFRYNSYGDCKYFTVKDQK
jgi:hypothetical protein